jgi:hypothetical protein
MYIHISQKRNWKNQKNCPENQQFFDSGIFKEPKPRQVSYNLETR